MRAAALGLATLTTATLAISRSLAAQSAGDAPRDTTCPPAIAAGTTCSAGRDPHGAYYLLLKPAAWNGILVVYEHSGPQYNRPPGMDQLFATAGARSMAPIVNAGYAMAMSSYRDQYWHVDWYAEDSEHARRLFVQRFGTPRRTYLQGTSYGAPVADRAAETYESSYDGVLLIAGAIDGTLLDITPYFDLRVVYQYYCHNLPAAGEPAYPLWMGWRYDDEPVALPTRFDTTFIERAFPGLLARVRQCTGFDLPDTARTAAQRRAFHNILAVTHIDSVDFRAHMGGSASYLYALRLAMTGGKNIFDNHAVRYRGSDDDDALNAGVARYTADPAASRAFFDATTPRGRTRLPVLSSHSINDPREPVEEESFYRAARARSGQGDRLVQVFTTRPNHPGTSWFENVVLLRALDAWAASGARPTSDAIADTCERSAPAGHACTFIPRYVPPPLSAIVPLDGRQPFLRRHP